MGSCCFSLRCLYLDKLCLQSARISLFSFIFSLSFPFSSEVAPPGCILCSRAPESNNSLCNTCGPEGFGTKS